MEAGKKRTQRDYSLAFKLSVVEQVEKGELTYKQAQRRYGIQGRSTVLVWLRKHGVQDWASRSHNAMTRLAMEKESNKPLTPEQRIKELETQLKRANEKANLLEAVVEVLKKDHGIQIVKKPLGKSSRKNSSRG